jgi:hypothetical protein
MRPDRQRAAAALRRRPAFSRARRLHGPVSAIRRRGAAGCHARRSGQPRADVPARCSVQIWFTFDSPLESENLRSGINGTAGLAHLTVEIRRPTRSTTG